MKQIEVKHGTIHVGDKVWWLRAEFEVEKIYRDKLGVVMLELDSNRDFLKEYGSVIAPASGVRFEYKNKYDNRGMN